MEAIASFAYEVDQTPNIEEAGTIQVYTTFIKPSNMDNIRLRNSTLKFSTRVYEFIEVPECGVKHRLHYSLKEAGLDDNDNVLLIEKLIGLAKLVAYSDEYTPKYALLIWLTFKIVSPTSNSYLEHLEIEEVSQSSLNVMEIDFTPASKLAIGSLKKENYLESNGVVEECMICLENFRIGQTIVCLPCGHIFDEDCIVKWLATSRLCPLCRFQLPCEDERVYINTSLLSR